MTGGTLTLLTRETWAARLAVGKCAGFSPRLIRASDPVRHGVLAELSGMLPALPRRLAGCSTDSLGSRFVSYVCSMVWGWKEVW